MRVTALVLLAACASAPAGSPPGHAVNAAACAPRGGTLAIATERGEPLACRSVTVVRAGQVLFAGETDDRGLVAVNAEPGEELSVRIDGSSGENAHVVAPFGPGAPIALVGGNPQLWVLGEGGAPLPGVHVDLSRGGRTVFSGTTTALGALSGAPADLQGLTASGPELMPAPVDPSTRTVTLSPRT